MIELAIAFVVNHPAVTSAIIRPRTMEQLESQLPAADVVLDPALLDRIDEIVRPGVDLKPRRHELRRASAYSRATSALEEDRRIQRVPGLIPGAWSRAQKRPRNAGPFVNSGGRIRTCDLRVMSPTSYLAAPPRGAWTINGSTGSQGRNGRSGDALGGLAGQDQGSLSLQAAGSRALGVRRRGA